MVQGAEEEVLYEISIVMQIGLFSHNSPLRPDDMALPLVPSEVNPVRELPYMMSAMEGGQGKVAIVSEVA